jgi:hypothetical protein
MKSLHMRFRPEGFHSQVKMTAHAMGMGDIKELNI